MKKQTPTMKTFESLQEADDYMRMKNRAHAKGDRRVFCVLEGPDAGQWTVMDLKSAIETELPYTWAL